MTTQLPEVMSVDDVAAMLKCAVSTVETMARKGELPGEKFGDAWVFPSKALVNAVNEIAIHGAESRRRSQQNAASLKMVRKFSKNHPDFSRTVAATGMAGF